MFEIYTEKARRVIFFARYEASQFGSPYIETEHLLLGLLREDRPLAARFLKSSDAGESIRQQIVESTSAGEHLPTSVDLPLSNPSKRALAHAYEESQRLAHRHIGTEHLLLGLLREPSTLATRLLTDRGLSADALRAELFAHPHESPLQTSGFAEIAAARAKQPAHSTGTLASELANSQSVLADRLRNLAESQRILADQLRRLAAINGTTQRGVGSVVHHPHPETRQLLRSIRIWLTVVIVGLVLSGVTAFPLQHETALLVRAAASLNLNIHAPALNAWLIRVASALADTDARYPFLAYGTDWLAFAHLVIAAAFIGPWLDPVRNKWIIAWGFFCCAGVVPLALIAGPVRGIPIYWRLIDCYFGIVCCLALLLLRRSLIRLEALAPCRP